VSLERLGIQGLATFSDFKRNLDTVAQQAQRDDGRPATYIAPFYTYATLFSKDADRSLVSRAGAVILSGMRHVKIWGCWGLFILNTGMVVRVKAAHDKSLSVVIM
jgi:hypothetical protein